jgi:hypothetical protein
MTTLSNDKKSVNFDFGGRLDNFQVEAICQQNRNNDNEIREYLKERKSDGWVSDEAIEEFIDFKNSELINEMIF